MAVVWLWAGAASLPFIAVAGSLAYNIVTIACQRWRYRHIPGPKPNLILGNVPDIVKLGGGHAAWKVWAQEFGPVYKFFIMNTCMVVVADPDLARQVLFKFGNHNPFVSPALRFMRDDLQQLTARGLLQAQDSLWRTLRNAWQPAFAPGTLDRYKVLMASCADQLCGLLAGRGSGAAPAPAGDIALVNGTGGETDDYVDIHEVLNQMTLEVVGTCAFGVRFHALDAKEQGQHAQQEEHVGPKLQQCCKDFFNMFSFTSSTKWSSVAAMMPPLHGVIRQLANTFPDVALSNQIKSHEVTLQLTQKLINDWRAKADSQATSPNPQELSKPPAGKLSGVEPGSFLGLLLDAQHKAARNPGAEKLDDLTLTAQAMQFILAGTETTANTLAFAVYLLSTNPDKEARLLQELDAHGGSTPITADDKFPYVDAIVKETLRILPSAHGTTRVASPVPKEGFKVGGYTVYDKTPIITTFLLMHNDPAYWPRPDEFLPERWLPEGEAELGPRNPNCYMPFGAGTRQCPGYKFAQQEARIALVALYRAFTFKLQPGQEPLQLRSTLTLGPRAGVLVKPIARVC